MTLRENRMGALPWLAAGAVGLAVAGWWMLSADPTDPGPQTPIASAAEVPYAVTPGAVPGFPDYRSSPHPNPQHLPLHVLEPRAQLPELERSDVGDRFELEAGPLPNPRGAARELMVLRAELPFPVDADDQLFRPSDMEVQIDGKTIPFSRRPAPRARTSTWRINGPHLILTHHEMPARGALTLEYAGVSERLERHDPAASGLSSAEFTKLDVTLGRHTRSGRLLVAPSTLEWDITIPQGDARFEGWVAMEPPPLVQPKTDGATLTLTVRHEGSDTEIGRIEVAPRGERFERWQADLSRWAGKAVTLQMRADPKASPTYDWVFVGSPTVWGPPTSDVRRIVVVGIDTTRPDHLSFAGYRRATTPEIDAFADSGVVFSQTWAPAPRTRPSFRSATTGRRPLDAVGADNLGAVFRDQGFATAGFVANPHLQPHFDFSDGFDTWQFDGRANAEQQVDRALGWLETHQDRDSYLFLHIMDPHMPYGAPEPFRNRFVSDPDPSLPPRISRRDVFSRMSAGTLTDRQKTELEALHDGELAYTSHHLGRLFDTLDRMPGRTVVVLHTDHGEEFWEHGGFEHNHTLYDEVTRAALVIRPRGGLAEGRTIEVPATLADIGPTLFDLFGVASPPPLDGRTLVPLIANGAAPWPDRPIPIAHVQYSHERWGVVWQGHKYILHTGTGEEELYDLGADPGERQSLAGQRDLDPFREQLALSHEIVVGPGWRIRLQLRKHDATPIEIALPAGAITAGVLDPEAITEHRANIEWGDRPKRTPTDIGTVALSSEGRTLTFTPGTAPGGGVLYAVFPEPADPHRATVTTSNGPAAPSPGKLGPRFAVPGGAVVLDPGTVVIPPPTEAARMGLVKGAAPQTEDRDLLCRLGYITDCDETDDSP